MAVETLRFGKDRGRKRADIVSRNPAKAGVRGNGGLKPTVFAERGKL